MNLEKNMKVAKIDSLSDTELKNYKANSNIRRRKVISGGYTDVVFATDSDLD